jgi:hypothetical protein
MWRIEPQYVSGDANQTVVDSFASTIFDLTPGTDYDVRVTLTVDGVPTGATKTFSTRSLPPSAASGGTSTVTVSSESALLTAIGNAVAGTVIEIDTSFSLTARRDIVSKQGTAANPIYIRGTSQSIVVTYVSNNAGFRTDNCAHLIFENFTYVGLGADGGGSSA